MGKNIISIILMLVVAVAMIVSGTMAWFSASMKLPNTVLVAGAGTVTINLDLQTQGDQTEIGTVVKDSWIPGTVTTLSWKVVNNGEDPLVFRFLPEVDVQRLRWDFDYSVLPSLPDSWNGENLSGVFSGSSGENWVTENGNDESNWNERIYYYTPVVQAGEEVIISMDITLIGEETGNAYQGASFIIGGFIEAIQFAGNAPYEIWGVDYYNDYTIQDPHQGHNIVEAESGAQEDVQAAIDQAQGGDAVLIPAGTWIWTTPASKTPSVRIKDKTIILMGAGIEQTIIHDQTGVAYHEVPLLVYPTEETQMRITGISFLSELNGQIGIEIAVHGGNWRIDHCSFKGHYGTGRGIKAMGIGVVDHCTFCNHGQGVSVFGEGHKSWAEPLTLGSENAVFIEDCTFSYDDFYDGALDAYNGARYVFRYNQTSTFLGHHGLDSGGYRSTFSSEIYENLIIPMKNPPFIFGSRGGTGVWFNNLVKGSFPASSARLRLVNYRTTNSYDPWGMCDGSNPIDGNEQENGYPARDQIGCSTDERLWGGVGDLPAPKQAHEPYYAWGNTYNGNLIGLAVYDLVYAVHIQENRDYYNTSRPEYVPYQYPHPLTLADYPDEQRSLDLEAVVLGNQVELQWQAVINAVTYRIVLDWNQDNATETYGTSASFQVSGQETVFTVYALDAGGTVIAAEGKHLEF
jgi:hypothetical protein